MVGYGFHFIPCHNISYIQKKLLNISHNQKKIKEHLDFVKIFQTRNEIKNFLFHQNTYNPLFPKFISIIRF